jgi:hypothetical protein
LRIAGCGFIADWARKSAIADSCGLVRSADCGLLRIGARNPQLSIPADWRAGAPPQSAIQTAITQSARIRNPANPQELTIADCVPNPQQIRNPQSAIRN